MLVKPGELVGLKVNTLGGRGISSNLQLVEAICERLQEAGIQANAIVVWDRETEELERAGIIYRRQGLGTFVADHGPDRSRTAKLDAARELLHQAARAAAEAGLSPAETLELARKIIQGTSYEPPCH